jgi:hypothetical protein
MRNDRNGGVSEPVANHDSSGRRTNIHQRREVGITRIAAVAAFLSLVFASMLTHRDKIGSIDDLMQRYSEISSELISIYSMAIGIFVYGAVVMLCRIGIWIEYGFLRAETYTIKNVFHIKYKNFIVSFLLILSMLYISSAFLKLVKESNIFGLLQKMLQLF